MKCQILFSGKNKKNNIILSSAENAQRVVKVKLILLSEGNPRDQRLGAQCLLLFLAPHQVGFFRISRFITDGLCSNKAQSTRKIMLFLMV